MTNLNLCCSQKVSLHVHNVAKTTAAHPLTTIFFEHLIMDFIELTPSEGTQYCLVMVDVVKMG